MSSSVSRVHFAQPGIPTDEKPPMNVAYFMSAVERLFEVRGPLCDLKLRGFEYDAKTNMISVAVDGSWRPQTQARIERIINRAVDGHPMAGGNAYKVVDQSSEEGVHRA